MSTIYKIEDHYFNFVIVKTNRNFISIFNQSWSRERAIEYMLNYTAYGEADMTIEIDRYLTWPGQACAYKIGELKIRELRNKATETLGKI